MNNEIYLRLLKDNEEDYRLLYKWCQNESIYKYFHHRILSYNEVVATYSKRTALNSDTPVFIINYNKIPVGIIQYTKLDTNTKNKYKVTKDGYDVDIFIGEETYRHKGIATKTIKNIVNKLKTSNNVIAMVPEVDNVKAIKCYEKSGFKKYYYYTETNTIGIMTKKVVMIYE